MRIYLIIILTLGFTTLHSQDSCKITYISNEGFLIETQGKKVLIDGLFDHIEGNWCDSPAEQSTSNGNLSQAGV
jgi:hypothetical protein